jgi:hypothetical protein
MAVDVSRIRHVPLFAGLSDAQLVIATSDGTVLAMFGADFAMLSSEIPELKQRIDAAITERLPRASGS